MREGKKERERSMETKHECNEGKEKYVKCYLLFSISVLYDLSFCYILCYVS